MNVEKSKKICSNPECDQPGTKACSACKTTLYCGPICQTADWGHHKEECQEHLRKVGTSNLTKAVSFHEQQNWLQVIHCSLIAAAKLKQLKDRRLETVVDISDAMTGMYNALTHLNRHDEALECIQECFTLWIMNHLRNPGSVHVSLLLIQCYINNKKFETAEQYARETYAVIAELTDNFIPADQRLKFLANGSYWLAVAIYRLTEAGGIPSEEKQKAGEESITLARKALELQIQLDGTESIDVA